MSMTVNSIAKNQMDSALMKISSMKRVNTAADDAAGLAIMEEMEKEIRGLQKGTDNTLDMQNLLKTAEGGLSQIDDSLQRIRELSVQASNGIYTQEDRALIQSEIKQHLDNIDSLTQNTEFNNKKLLDGSFQNQHTASSPDGSGATISIPDMSTGSTALGSIMNFDVTQDFSIDDIDNAINGVSNTRAYLGAMMNRFDSTVESNNITMLNQAAAKSRIADLDIAKAMNDMNRSRLLTEAQIYNQRRQQQQMTNPVSALL